MSHGRQTPLHFQTFVFTYVCESLRAAAPSHVVHPLVISWRSAFQCVRLYTAHAYSPLAITLVTLSHKFVIWSDLAKPFTVLSSQTCWRDLS